MKSNSSTWKTSVWSRVFGKSKLEESKEALSEASGITNDSILENLFRLGIDAEMVAALQLVPLLEVVWAAGELDEKEKQAVLKAARG